MARAFRSIGWVYMDGQVPERILIRAAPFDRASQSRWKTSLRSFAIGLLSGLEGMISRM